jgi:two-component system OmpR family sensor kinase
MKRRLFWKILIGFFVTFVGIVEGVWVLFALEGGPLIMKEMHESEQIAHTRIAEASKAVMYGGPNALADVISRWDTQDRKSIVVEPLARPDALRSSERGNTQDLFMTSKITGTDNQRYRISYTMPDNWPEPRSPQFLNPPMEIVILGIAGGILFSSGLAWYMTRPIHRLRSGFEQLAKGDFGVRLQKEMGGRRDELADLARDFDRMASHIGHLVGSRDQLLYDVSHELRSPLARLHMAMGLLRQTPSRTGEMLGRIESEANRLDDMVGELLTLFRVESGVPQFENYFDIKGLVYAVIEDARFEAGASGIMIKTNIVSSEEQEDISSAFKGNVQLLRRAFENVIRNAIRHSAGKDIEVNFVWHMAMQCYVITICDQGEGVPESKLSFIFEPFIRLQENTAGPGFGLGLAISQRAIVAHGGTIQAENLAQGGFMVTITLPCNSNATSPAKAA